MAPVIPVLMVLSTVVSAYGAYQQGQSAKKAGEFNAQIAEQDAQIARQDAAAQAEQSQREGYMRLGALRASAGASGGGMAGSALDVLGDVARQNVLETQTIRHRGEMAARGHGNTAALERFSGKEAARAGVLRAGGELLSGSASAYGALKRG